MAAPGEGGKGTKLSLLNFLGANGTSQPAGSGGSSGTVSYLKGRDAKGWQIGLPAYDSVTYPQLYPGIDLTVAADGRQLRLSFNVGAGGDAKAIRWTFGGVEGAPEISKGSVATASIPVAAAGSLPAVRTSTGAIAAGSVPSGFAPGTAADRDATVATLGAEGLSHLVVFGGSGDDEATAVTLLADGSIAVAGTTDSTDLPVLGGAQGGSSGGRDAFVARLDPASGRLLASTYLGTSGDDGAEGIAVSTAGEVWVAGRTTGTVRPSGAPINFKTVFPANAGAMDSYTLTVLPATLDVIAAEHHILAPDLGEPVSIWVDCDEYMVLGTPSSVTAGCDLGSWDVTYELSIATGYNGDENNWGDLAMQWKQMKNAGTHTYDPALCTFPDPDIVVAGDEGLLNTSEVDAFTPSNPSGTWQSNTADEGPNSDDAAKLSVGIAMYFHIWDSPVFATMSSGGDDQAEMSPASTSVMTAPPRPSRALRGSLAGRRRQLERDRRYRRGVSTPRRALRGRRRSDSLRRPLHLLPLPGPAELPAGRLPQRRQLRVRLSERFEQDLRRRSAGDRTERLEPDPGVRGESGAEPADRGTGNGDGLPGGPGRRLPDGERQRSDDALDVALWTTTSAVRS